MLMLVRAIPANASYEFAADVRAGLTRPGQKELPSKYLYDDVGSALFEVICHLPEYGLTRADERLLRRHASDIVDRVGGPVAVAELGSGSGRKTRWLLEAFARRQRIAPNGRFRVKEKLRALAFSFCGFTWRGFFWMIGAFG